MTRPASFAVACPHCGTRICYATADENGGPYRNERQREPLACPNCGAEFYAVAKRDAPRFRSREHEARSAPLPPLPR